MNNKWRLRTSHVRVERSNGHEMFVKVGKFLIMYMHVPCFVYVYMQVHSACFNFKTLRHSILACHALIHIRYFLLACAHSYQSLITLTLIEKFEGGWLQMLRLLLFFVRPNNGNLFRVRG